MQSRITLFSALAVLLVFCSGSVYSQEYGEGDAARIQPAAFHPSAAPADKKKPITRGEVNSGAFQKIRQITGVGMVEIGMLYETSGAKDFDEFCLAFVVARNLRLDPQIVSRALWNLSLEEILQDFGYPKDQAKRALKIAKDQIEYANKEWKEGRPVR